MSRSFGHSKIIYGQDRTMDNIILIRFDRNCEVSRYAIKNLSFIAYIGVYVGSCFCVFDAPESGIMSLLNIYR